jgi:uncharacterized 2Fe-2S/4Fe-4S cluster protein (DUF4445 family)
MTKKTQTKKKKKRKPTGPPQARTRKTRRAWLNLNVLPDDLWLQVRRGTTIFEALREQGVELESDCGGLGKCGKCKVRVLSSIGRPHKDEWEFISEEEYRQGIRLACRRKINKDLQISLGESDRELEYVQILQAGERPLLRIDPLIERKIVALPRETREEEALSDLERVKLVMGPGYQDVQASLHSLRTLPDLARGEDFHGVAVLHQNRMLGWQGWEQASRAYGLVFDLGTSTLVGKLIDLSDGSEIAAVSRLNGQHKYGTNVISRLGHLKENPEGLGRLHELLIRDLNRIIQRLLGVAGVDPQEVFVGVAAGNTTMQHLLMRVSPLGIAEAPFSPVLTQGLALKAAELGLKLHPEARLYVMPVRSGYIGGDLIGVILASGAAEQEDGIVLGLDLGTNGEIFLGNRKRMLTCSAAAGPALEGAQITHGMIARAGAIEAVNTGEHDLEYRIVGNIKPRGMCGSGLVDLVAILLHHGIIDAQGLIRRYEGAPDYMNVRVVDRSGVPAYLVAPPEECLEPRPIHLTQKDVREVQLAKGAIAAGIQTLADEAGVELSEIAWLYLAGALGNYVNAFSAMRIGLLPRVDPEIIVPLGNAATSGAAMALLSRDHWDKANRLSRSIEHVELSTRTDFNRYFTSSLDFPEENLW